ENALGPGPVRTLAPAQTPTSEGSTPEQDGAQDVRPGWNAWDATAAAGLGQRRRRLDGRLDRRAADDGNRANHAQLGMQDAVVLVRSGRGELQAVALRGTGHRAIEPRVHQSGAVVGVAAGRREVLLKARLGRSDGRP